EGYRTTQGPRVTEPAVGEQDGGRAGRKGKPNGPKVGGKAPGREARPARELRGTRKLEKETGGVVQPPLPISLARGMGAAGRSPTILVTSFLGVLALWFAFTGHGRVIAPAPSAMVLFEALPPIHSLLDLQFLTAGRSGSLAVGLGLGMGLLV